MLSIVIVIYIITIFISEDNALIFLQAAASWSTVDITYVGKGNTVQLFLMTRSTLYRLRK